MNKKKRVLVAVVVILVVAAVIAAGIFAYLWHQKNSLTAKVQSVSELSWYYGGEEMTSYGMVTNDFFQDVYLIENQSISEVHVEEGQEVKAGDPLLTYDTTLTSLQLEMQTLEVEGLENKLILANRELERLKKETPIPEPVDEPEPVEEPEPEPEPEPELPKTDPNTGAYNYLTDEEAFLSMSGVTKHERKPLEGDSEEEDNSKEDKEQEELPVEPFVIQCMPGCYVEGSYLNALAAAEELILVRLQIINPKNGKPVKDKYWDISSRQFAGMTFADDARWSVETKSPMEEEWPDDLDWTDDSGWMDEGVDDIGGAEEPQGYTAKELAEAIKKAEKEIKDGDLAVRKAKLELEQMQKVSDDGTVVAEIDGVVKSVGDPSSPPQDGSAFITVSGSEGLYVTGSLSELQLGEVEVGQVVYAKILFLIGMYKY